MYIRRYNTFINENILSLNIVDLQNYFQSLIDQSNTSKFNIEDLYNDTGGKIGYKIILCFDLDKEFQSHDVMSELKHIVFNVKMDYPEISAYHNVTWRDNDLMRILIYITKYDFKKSWNTKLI